MPPLCMSGGIFEKSGDLNLHWQSLDIIYIK